MQSPIQLTFRDIAPSPAITEYVEKRARKIEAHHTRITSCHVVLAAPHRSHLHGRRYHVRVDVLVPGSELVASKGENDEGHTDLYAAIDDAFDDAQRLLREHARRQRETHAR
jgi:ribosomal subunit interface protein